MIALLKNKKKMPYELVLPMVGDIIEYVRPYSSSIEARSRIGDDRDKADKAGELQLSRVEFGTRFAVSRVWHSNDVCVDSYGVRWVRLEGYGEEDRDRDRSAGGELYWMPTYRFNIINRADNSRIEDDAHYVNGVLTYRDKK